MRKAIMSAFWILLTMTACTDGVDGPGADENLEGEDIFNAIGVQTSLLTLQPTEDGRRAAVVMEAARAVFGPNATQAPPWPVAGEQKSLFRYVPEDPGAWSLLVGAYGNASSYNDVSCRNPGGTYNNPCRPAEILYGPVDPLQYTCQATYGTSACPASNPPTTTYYHGGQCHAFANLLLYRSGQYQNPGYAFRKLPSSPSSSYATPASLKVGDVLRKTDGSPHTMIVVKILDAATMKVVVVDSNVLASSYAERYGARVTTIPAGTFRDMDCVYAGTC